MVHKFGLISDTHGALHPAIHKIFSGVREILHAGDVGGEEILYELRLIAPVFAVVGNTDYPHPELPLRRVVDLPFGDVGLTHGHREPADQPARVKSLLSTFESKTLRVVMHGHSHLQYLDYRRGVWVVNPGSAGRPRFETTPSVAVLEWDDDTDLIQIRFQQLLW